VKIAQLCLSPALGGLELFALRFAEWLQGEGVETLFIAAPDSRLHRLAVSEGLEVQPVPRPRSPLPWRAAARLRRWLQHQGVTHLHAHWKDDLPLAALARRGALFRLVFSRQMELPGAKHDPYHRLIYRSIDRYHVITERLARQARARLPIPEERIQVIHPGVPPWEGEPFPLRGRLGIGEGAFLAGIVGRIAPPKGQHLLIEAVARLVQAGRDVHLLVMGHPMAPDDLPRLQAQVALLGIRSRVHFLDFHPQPQGIMAALDCLVLASREETFGLVLPEAMRAGTAVIGTDAGGVPEIIDHRRTGLLVPPEDVGALAGALAELMDAPDLRTRLARAGQRAAGRRFDRDTRFRALLALLRRA